MPRSGEGKWELNVNWNDRSFGGDGNVLKLDCGQAQYKIKMFKKQDFCPLSSRSVMILFICYITLCFLSHEDTCWVSIDLHGHARAHISNPDLPWVHNPAGVGGDSSN